MCIQEHHVIPKELGEFLFFYNINWDEEFAGSVVAMQQCGPHYIYTERIKKIIEENCEIGKRNENRAKIKAFANNLIKMIKEKYSSCFPDDIPKSALEQCFSNVTPCSSSGRELKPVYRY